MDKTFLLLAALLGGLAVGLGAFGAHALESRLSSDMLGTFEIGVRYQMYHALALLAVAILLGRNPELGVATLAGWLFVAGIVIFSGSLYILVFSGIRWLGAITPIGGVAFIGGWISLMVAALRL